MHIFSNQLEEISFLIKIPPIVQICINLTKSLIATLVLSTRDLKFLQMPSPTWRPGYPKPKENRFDYNCLWTLIAFCIALMSNIIFHMGKMVMFYSISPRRWTLTEMLEVMSCLVCISTFSNNDTICWKTK